jgi:hypothetical protein
MLRGRIWTLLILLAAVAVAPAFPSTITWYTNQTAWLAAVSGLYTVDFNSVATTPGAYVTSSTNPGFTFSAAAFTNMYNSTVYPTLIGYGVASGYFPFDYGTGAYLQGMGNATSGTYLRVKLTPGQTAASALLATGLNGTAGTNIKVTLSSGDSYVLPTSSTAWTFLGFVSDTLITEIDISAVTSNAYPFVDNFSYGSASTSSGTSDTPDLGTMFLCGAGLTLLSFAGRFRSVFHR